MSEVYGIPADEDVSDVTWLELAGSQGWPVLMKDERIRYRAAERDALVAHGVKALCLTSPNLRAAEMAAQFLAARYQLSVACMQPGPFLYAVSARGLRRLDLS